VINQAVRKGYPCRQTLKFGEGGTSDDVTLVFLGSQVNFTWKKKVNRWFRGSPVLNSSWIFQRMLCRRHVLKEFMQYWLIWSFQPLTPFWSRRKPCTSEWIYGDRGLKRQPRSQMLGDGQRPSMICSVDTCWHIKSYQIDKSMPIYQTLSIVWSVTRIPFWHILATATVGKHGQPPVESSSLRFSLALLEWPNAAEGFEQSLAVSVARQRRSYVPTLQPGK
jgi:hypothetical protein